MMKKTPLLFILILALIGVIGCSDSNGPENTVRGFIAAIEDKDIDKMASYCTTEYIETRDLDNFEEQTEGASVKYSNISTEIVEQNEYDAEINVRYHYQINIEHKTGGGGFSGNTAATFFLIKVDDSWLTDGDYDEIIETERNSVQIRLTEFMADQGINSITPQTTWTKDLSDISFNEGVIPLDEKSPVYVLYSVSPLQAYYQWDSEGNVYQCKDTSCPDPF